MRKAALLSALALTMLVGATLTAGSASAGNYSSPQLSAAASWVAGRPVSVWCETSDYDWARYAQLSRDGNILGFWWAGQPNQVYLAPSQCQTLAGYLTLHRVDEVGVYNLASALFTLTHEAVHARLYGGDEGLVDCTAMPLVPQVATSFFSIPSTVVQAGYQAVKRTVKVKVGRRTYSGSYLAAVPYQQTVTNPELQRLTNWLEPLHKARPAAYQGTC